MQRSRPAHVARRCLAAIVVGALGWLGWSIGGALTAPGTDPASARVAEWGRQHHLGWAVTGLERGWYEANPPKVGGTVAGGIPKIRPRRDSPRATPSATTRARRASAIVNAKHSSDRTPKTRANRTTPLTPPARLRPLGGRPLAREGTWQTLLSVDGAPAAKVAFLRPDSAHTSYLADVVWMDPHLLKFELYPGIRYPGQPNTGPSHLGGRSLSRVLATFNSGFQLKDSHGGYWQDGKTTQPLQKGAASMVFGINGSLSIRKWPGGTPGPAVDAVRQNLSMLIQNGKISPLVANPQPDTWGATVGNDAYVWRTGIGVRADGSIVFVLGPALDIRGLANVLADAGAMQAMETDINPAWTDFFTYAHPSHDVAVPARLGTDDMPYLYRYLKPCTRDFIAVFAR